MQLEVRNRIVFTGFRRDVERVMSSIDVLVLPSLAEPFGKVIIEAMAAGKCVVASDVGGIPEILTDPSIGTLVPPGDVQRFAEAVSAYLRDYDLRAATGELAREHVMTRFDLRTVMRQIEAVYDEALSMRGPEKWASLPAWLSPGLTRYLSAQRTLSMAAEPRGP
jgi:glycosyltransferase involved in cell wall biosynthesis